MKKPFTRLTALALSLALLLTSCGGGASATSMHLRKTEGTVDVSDGEGKEVADDEDLTKIVLDTTEINIAAYNIHTDIYRDSGSRKPEERYEEIRSRFSTVKLLAHSPDGKTLVIDAG